ncbi:peptidylprolyl isomerase [Christensenella hongkongensis]|uniref:Foldase protein PrsA n=1 Tax=Christensenella hongkongensis TaxID=270498 RepID=A0A0M2NMZ5_9FIRM|nr:peptidylprolyl isomerase [Christensenella hongkongensis]KKI51575.1 Foldase protein PrsA precursor [Christensenella hongkongensis]TCW25498.1 peptidyl-prolyl cis-trans isomerase C [Christensenella hongkongensis]
MSILKKIMVTGVSVVLCAALFVSCSMVSVNTDKDRAQVVANVNGTDVTKAQVMDLVDMQLSMIYGMTKEQFISQYGEEQWKKFKESTLDMVIRTELTIQQAQKDGFYDDSDENKAKVKADIEQKIEERRQQVQEQADKDDTVTDKEAYVNEQMEQYLKGYGYDDIDQAVIDTIKTDAVNAENDKIKAEVSYTEDEAKAYYDEQLTEQQAKIDEDASNYASYSSGISVYRPQGSRFIKNLLIGLPEDAQSQISNLRKSGDDEGADKLLNEELAKIKSQADGALARAKAGEDFDALIEELGTDSGMKQEPAKTQGYVVYEGSNYVEAFEKAAMALPAAGAISELVPTDYGYHILQYVGDAGGAVPFDEIKDTIMEKKLTEVQNKHQEDKFLEWEEASDIKKYTDRLSTFEG